MDIFPCCFLGGVGAQVGSKARFLCVDLAVLELAQFVYQAGLELRDPPASSPKALGLKVCRHLACFGIFLIKDICVYKYAFLP